LTQKLTFDEIQRLFNSTHATLTKWIDLLRSDKIRTGSRSDRVDVTLKATGNLISTRRCAC
jgi:hypothetical protein